VCSQGRKIVLVMHQLSCAWTTPENGDNNVAGCDFQPLSKSWCRKSGYESLFTTRAQMRFTSDPADRFDVETNTAFLDLITSNSVVGIFTGHTHNPGWLDKWISYKGTIIPKLNSGASW
jgi:hypothetical protein